MSKKLLHFRAAFMLVGSMLLALLAGSGAMAQGVTTSSINGVVTDDKGAALPGATIVAVHTPSGTKYGITTNSSGRYSFPAVRIGGPYRITVSFVGFQEQTREITDASLGTPVQANFRLAEEGKALTEVVVTSQRGGIIDSERTGASTNFKREAFERLPTLNRSFQDISALTPQAGSSFSFGGRSNLYNNFSIDGATSNNVFGLSALPGGQSNAQPVSVDAIQELSVQLSPYDVSQGSFTGAGVNAVTRSGTNETQGSAYYFVKSDAIASKKIGGTALTDLQKTSGKFTYNNYGARLGGAIIKNKLFYFVNAEYEKATSPAVVYPADSPGSSVKSADLETLRTFLITPNNGKSWTFDPGTYNNFDVPQQSVKLLAKIDWNINDKHKFTIRYNQLNAFRDVAPSGSGGFRGGPSGGRSNTVNTIPFSNSYYRIKNSLYSIIGELNSTIGSGKFANNLQIGYNAFRDIRQQGGGGAIPSFPLVDILSNGTTLTSFGPDPFTPNNRLDQDVIQVNDKFDMFLGDHTVTVGTANEFYRFYNVFTQVINGVYQYNSVSDFIANATNPSATNAPSLFYQQYSALPDNPAPAADWKAAQFGFYAQDAYAGIKNLRLTLGVRVDIPTYSKSSKLYGNSYVSEATFNNGEKLDVAQLPKTTPLLSPRLGFNWDVLGNKSVQLRGGVGVFTGRVPFVWISNQLSNNGVFFGTTVATPTAATNPVSLTNGQANPSNTTNTPFSPNVTQYVPKDLPPYDGSPKTPSFAINVTSPNFKFPQVFRANIAVDKTLPGGFVATGELIYTKDINAIYIRNANLPNPVGTVAGDGRPLYAPNNSINSRISQALVIDNTNKGYAFSVTGQLQKTSGRLNGSVAYTFTDSKDINNQGGSTAGSLYTGNPYVSDPGYPNLAYSNNWVPHRVVGYVSYRFDYLKAAATTLSLIYQGASAGNFSYLYSGNVNGDDVSNADLMYIPRSQNEVLLTTSSATDTRTTQQIWDQLNTYINQDPYLSKHRGEYAQRNGALLPWFNSLNFRLLQDFYVKVGSKRNTLQLSWEVINVLNFLKSDWGLLKTPIRNSLLTFSGYETPNTPTGTTGRPIYTFTTPTDASGNITSYTNNVTVSNATTNSRWQMQLGLRYIFN